MHTHLYTCTLLHFYTLRKNKNKVILLYIRYAREINYIIIILSDNLIITKV